MYKNSTQTLQVEVSPGIRPPHHRDCLVLAQPVACRRLCIEAIESVVTTMCMIVNLGNPMYSVYITLIKLRRAFGLLGDLYTA